MKVGITGYSGYLGKSLVDKLVNKKIEVIKIGRRSDSDIKVDLNNYIAPKSFRGIDCLIHCAGIAHNKQLSRKQLKVVNFQASENLFKDAYNAGIRKIIFISTVAVYGKTYGIGINESEKLEPKTEYGITKLAAEESLQSLCLNKKDLRAMVLRLPLIVGKGAPGNLERLIISIKKGYHLSLSGNNSLKSVVFKSDVSSTIINWLLLEPKENIQLNLCSGSPSFNQIEKDLARLFDKRIFSIPVNPLFFMIKSSQRYLGLYIPVLSKIGLSLTFETLHQFDFISTSTYTYQNLSNEFNENN